MHPPLQELVGLLATARAEVLAAVARAGDPAPPPGAWSVPEVLDHLRLIEVSVSKLVHVQLSRHSGPLPREANMASRAHDLDYASIVEGLQKRAAPEMVRPRQGLSTATAIANLAESREKLLETLVQADGVALGEFSYPHPYLGSLNLYQWLLLLGQHERRHARQIVELAAS